MGNTCKTCGCLAVLTDDGFCSVECHEVVRYKRLRPEVLMLGRGTTHAAGFDLRWHPSWECSGGVTIFRSALLETGVAFQIPQGWVGLVFSRSGHGFNHDTCLANAVGVIDADYRGEVKVKLIRHRAGDGAGVSQLIVKPGDRIAQIVFVRHATELREVTDLDASDRGEKGFGSTGA